MHQFHEFLGVSFLAGFSHLEPLCVGADARHSVPASESEEMRKTKKGAQVRVSLPKALAKASFMYCLPKSQILNPKESLSLFPYEKSIYVGMLSA